MNLALVMEKQGDLQGTRKLREAIVLANEQQLGPDHFQVKQSKANL